MKIPKKIKAFLKAKEILEEAGMELQAIKLKGAFPELYEMNFTAIPSLRTCSLFGVELL